VLHWISKQDAVGAEVRLFNTLFKSENPNALEDFTTDLNPESLIVMKDSLIQKQVHDAAKDQDKF